MKRFSIIGFLIVLFRPLARCVYTGRLTLDPGTTKNDEGRVFPFTEELRAFLKAQRAITDKLQHEKGIV